MNLQPVTAGNGASPHPRDSLSEAEEELGRAIEGITEAAATDDPLTRNLRLSFAKGEIENALISIRGARQARPYTAAETEWDGV